MSGTPLQYRRASRAGDAIIGRLRQREGRDVLRIVLQCVVGLPCLFIGPVLLSAVYFGVVLSLLGFEGLAYGSLVFWISVLVLIPLLFWTEKRTGGNYFADTVKQANPDGSRAVNYMVLGSMGMLGAFIANPRLSAAGLVELFLFGPRMILSAYEGLKRIRALKDVDRVRAADLVADLVGAPGAIEVEKLLKEGETLEMIILCMAYLLYYQWMDIAKNRDRVWILSDVRADLAAHLASVAGALNGSGQSTGR